MIKLSLKTRRLSFFFWSLFFLFFMIIGLSEASFITGDQGDMYQQLFDSIPPYVLAVYGLVGINFAQLDGFYAIMIVFSILAIYIYSYTILSSYFTNEESDHTFEYSLTRPLTREYIATSKYISATLYVTLLTLVCYLASILGVLQYDDADYTYIAKACLLVWTSGLFTLGLTGIILYLVPNFKKVTLINGILLGIFYLIFVISQLDMDIEFLQYITPFNIYSATNILDNESLVYPIVLAIILYVIGFFATRKALVKKEF